MRDLLLMLPAYVLAAIVVASVTYLGASGALESEAVAALLGAVLTGPAAYQLGRMRSGTNPPTGTGEA